MAYKFSKGTRGFGDIVFEEDSDTGIDFEDDTIKLETDGAERLVATNDGIGIGTNSPSTTLHVSGTVSDDYMAMIDNAEGSSGHGLKIESYGNGTGTNLLDIVSRGSTLFQFRADGRLGIGTTTPGHMLSVAGNVGVNEYIYHNGDADTWMKFTNNAITFKAGNLSFINLDKKDSAPHELTVNDGSNNIDFIVKGNGSNEGNPLFKCDASTGRVGINGVGSPDCELHVDGDVKVVGNDPRIKIDGDVDSHPGLELYEDGTRKWIIYNDYNGDDLNIKTNSTVRVSIEQDGNVGIGTTSPTEKLDVNSDAIRIRTAQTPASATATGTAGMVCWDADYVYVCTATNTWRRAAISSW